MKWDLSEALKRTVVLLTGQEENLRRHALRELIAAAAAGDDFDLQTFVADSSTPSDWLASVGTVPFLSPRRVVVVRNLARIEATAIDVSNLPETSLLILVCDDEAGEWDRQRRFETNRKAWEKIFAKNLDVAVFDFPVDPKDFVKLIKAEAERQGKKINDRGAETLREMCGGNLSKAFEELEKLVLFAGPEPQIKESDVREVVLASPEWSVFKIIDAAIQRDPGRALRQLRTLVGNNAKVDDVAFAMIFPTFLNQLRLLWQARICSDRNASPTALPESISGLFPVRPNLSKEQEWKQRRLMETARNIDFRALSGCFQVLSDADSRMKGLLPQFSPQDTLERMVLEMVDAVS